MAANDIVIGLIAIIIGYLLGSIPSAYIAVRLATGKDIRQLGGGNVEESCCCCQPIERGIKKIRGVGFPRETASIIGEQYIQN